MKKQMIAAILGMAMVMGSAGMAMADTPADSITDAAEIKASVSFTATVVGEGEAQPATMSMAVQVDSIGGDAEGLPVCRVGEIISEEDGVKTMTVVSGVLDKEAFTKVLAALETGEKEQLEKLEAYDAYMALQDEISQLYAGLTEAGESEQKRLIEEVARLQEKQVNPVTDELIDKALEMELLEEQEISFSDAVNVELATIIPTSEIEE